MTAIAASPEMVQSAPVARSSSDMLGIAKVAKGSVYYPLQWLAGVTALYLLNAGAPPVDLVNKVMAVRAGGVAANAILGPPKPGISMGYKTPSENLYSGNLLSYGAQRTVFAATTTFWPLIIAVGMTLAMPYAAPVFTALGQSLSASGLALGGLAQVASAHSGLLAGAYHVGESAALLLGNAMQAWPTAFAMKEGVTIGGMVWNTAKSIFMINMVAGLMTDLIGLEKMNPYHRYKATRGEPPAPPAR